MQTTDGEPTLLQPQLQLLDSSGDTTPDSQSMLICQVTQSERHTPTVGKLWRVFVAAGSTPVVLFNTPICPSYWLP